MTIYGVSIAISLKGTLVEVGRRISIFRSSYSTGIVFNQNGMVKHKSLSVYQGPFRGHVAQKWAL